MRDAIARFDERLRSIGDPEPPSPPVTLRAACGYLFRRAVPALVPVGVAVVGQFLVGGVVAGTLLAAGSATAAAGGVAGAALALGRRLPPASAAFVAVTLLAGPPFAVAGGSDDLFAIQTGLFGIVTLFVAAVCYAETAGLSRAGVDGGDRRATR